MSSCLDISRKIRDELSEWVNRKNLGVLQEMVSPRIFYEFAPFCDKKLGYSKLKYRENVGVVFMDSNNKEVKVLRPVIPEIEDPYSYSLLRPLKEGIFDCLIKGSSLLYIFLEQNNTLIDNPEILDKLTVKWVSERLNGFPIIVDDLDLIDTLENFHDRLKDAWYSGFVTYREIINLKAVYSFPEIYKKEIKID